MMQTTQMDGKLCVMLDCSRDAVPNVAFLKTFIDDIALMGYNSLMLYTEETYEIKGEDYFGYLRGRFTVEEMKEINAYGKSKGIELIPCIQTLAHLNCLVQWYPYNEFTDCHDILLVGDERTYALIRKMFATMRECFDSEYLHVGMDEAHFLGRGKYQDQNGYRNRFDIINEHLGKVCEIAKEFGFKPVMWSDMFFRLATGGGYYADKPIQISQEVLDKVPESVDLCYWDYYSKNPVTVEAMIQSHKYFNNGLWFAGGCWCWSGFCPINYTSLEANEIALAACKKHDIKNVIMTMWGDNGHETSKRANYPSLFHAAMLYKGVTDINEINAKFTELFGLSMEELLLMDTPNLIYKKPTLQNFKNSDASNPNKHMLYNDCFLGHLDHCVISTAQEDYKNYAAALKKHVKNEKFGYAFDTLYKLCLVLEDKYDLGVKTRTAYKNKDVAALKELLTVYENLPEKVEALYQAFRKQWYFENKACGFEIHDARLGGLILRIKNCAVRLKEYIDGVTDSIEELEYDILPPYNDPSKVQQGQYFNDYSRNVTTGVL